MESFVPAESTHGPAGVTEAEGLSFSCKTDRARALLPITSLRLPPPYSNLGQAIRALPATPSRAGLLE